jgi:Rieske Fe-S protein
MAEPGVPAPSRRTLLAMGGSTHQGCTVSTVSDGTINCPCHGSKFSITNGSVVGGPAPSPLAAVSIKVHGTSIVRA